MDNATVLIVEDDTSIAQFVAASLSAAGLRPVTAATAAHGLDEARGHNPRLIIVDLGLPDLDGVELITRLRARSATPILVLSARIQEAQKIAALDAGADDYLTKPFGVGELIARVRAMLRRAAASPGPAPLVRVGGLALDREAHELRLDGSPVHLSPLEYRLLERLALAQGKVVTHRQLLADVWGTEQVDQLHYLRIYMGHLRAKIEANPAEPRYLLTELGVGYRLADE
ncbi:MAG: putative response regulator, OmpR [Ramlibacter sp.]|jgi:two-component system KDP operon response regulator KdpE|nr:putative response regulator, OmpR [Ramlibacter sp.]MDF2463922.1 putative response regulator, OmpR [Ramlibacter sp.]